MARITLSGLPLILGIFLFGLNLYGLNQPLRQYDIKVEDLRFSKDTETISYKQSISMIKENTSKKMSLDNIIKVNKVISDSLAHIQWDDVNNIYYRQRIPIWENYFLYIMGELSGMPEYQRYHYTNYKRSLERGIGICGDASMVLSEILEDNEIDNRIISLDGHVVVSSTLKNQGEMIFDPDYGVTIPYPLESIKRNPELISDYYSSGGYTLKEISVLKEIYKTDHKEWEGPQDYMFKRYYLEKLSYLFKWLLPFLLVVIPIFLFKKK